MADHTFTGIVEPRQLVAFVHRRVGEQATRILTTADTLRGLARQLEDLADLQASAEPEALRQVAIAVGSVATQALLTVSALPGIGTALAVLSEVRQLGTQ